MALLVLLHAVGEGKIYQVPVDTINAAQAAQLAQMQMLSRGVEAVPMTALDASALREMLERLENFEDTAASEGSTSDGGLLVLLHEMQENLLYQVPVATRNPEVAGVAAQRQLEKQGKKEVMPLSALSGDNLRELIILLEQYEDSLVDQEIR